MNKILKAFFFALLLTCLCSPVFAAESTDFPAVRDGNSETGQMEVIYTPDKRPPLKEIPKGNAVFAPMPVTGDTALAGVFVFMVTASASMLMLIIVIRKRRTKI